MLHTKRWSIFLLYPFCLPSPSATATAQHPFPFANLGLTSCSSELILGRIITLSEAHVTTFHHEHHLHLCSTLLMTTVISVKSDWRSDPGKSILQSSRNSTFSVSLNSLSIKNYVASRKHSVNIVGIYFVPSKWKNIPGLRLKPLFIVLLSQVNPLQENFTYVAPNFLLIDPNQ